ncbi:monooxygenase [Rhodofomes roseus]|uniref:Monooxygenase n=1 Tax=Rhodofomes roseus TaxID=34475 RepID=A0ABQ8K625_9APHY|nr:monooxygenase [Rhodofomes roseus]KAH9832239.1 monooxygenase [Rhodofomes roseus]
MSTITSETPGVLIVGAGPTGLTAALTLAKNGVPVRIIDKRSTFGTEQRGAGIHPRTLELFNYLDVLPDVWEKGIPFSPFQHYKLPGGVEPLGKPYWPVDPATPTPSIPWINPWLIGQCHTEAILRKHLATYGYEVELNTEFRSLEQSPDHVTVTTAKGEDGTEAITSASYRWVIAADGGRSALRKQLGIPFEGQQLPDRMVLGEMQLSGLDREHWHRWNDWGERIRPTVVFRPTETEDRFWFMVGGNVNYEKIISNRDALVETIRDCIERKDLQFGELYYVLEYKPSVRMVDRLSEGRVFLAGDAAHIHSPAGGQGLNTSVQDAFNLSWKLALVERGVAQTSLLYSYSAERLPVIKRMIQETRRIFELTMQSKARPEGMAPWGKSEGLRQLGVNYRSSPILVDERHADGAQQETYDAYGIGLGALGGVGLRAGDRAPDAPGLVDVTEAGSEVKTRSLFGIFRPVYHTVLMFGEDSTAASEVMDGLKAYPAQLLRVVTIHPQQGPVTAGVVTDITADFALRDGHGHAYTGYGCSPEVFSVVVVRPDGVVGAIVLGAKGVQKYFDRVFDAFQ